MNHSGGIIAVRDTSLTVIFYAPDALLTDIFI